MKESVVSDFIDAVDVDR